MLTSLVIASPVSASPVPNLTDPAPPASASGRTVEQALAEAHRTGTAVEATAAASETTTVTANPNGTVTLAQSAAPTRTQVDGEWQDLDATLVRNADGTWSPKVSQAPLRLSGGGTGPMAVLGGSRLNAAISAPMTLPEPTVDGATATYRGVLPGVDLQVTARATGGFSEVFVVHDATAAANPALAKITLPVKTSGLTLTADGNGNITGKDRLGGTVLTAPEPKMWDSATAAAGTNRVRSSATAAVEPSTALGPGTGATTADIGTAVYGDRIELTPDKSLLSATAKYPVYIDPTFTWQSAGERRRGWATVAKNYPDTNYWKNTPDLIGRMQVGYSQTILSRTLINFSVPTQIPANAVINTAEVSITETRSWSCNPKPVNLHAPSTILSSANATWNRWPLSSLGPVVDTVNSAYGYDGCPAKAIEFDVKNTIQAALKAGKQTQTFALVAGNESDTEGWKEFLETSPKMEITYNTRPNKPTGLRTSPVTSCAAGTEVGDGSVTLYAPVSDPDRHALGVRFMVWKSTSTTSFVLTDPQNVFYASGSTAVYKLSRDVLRTQAPEGTKTKFYWKVQATDYNMTSEWSATCSFVLDRMRYGPPEIDPLPDTRMGDPVTVTVMPPDTPAGTAPPAKYLYQLNSGPYGTVIATNGVAEFSVTPSRFTNTLSVTSMSSAGTVGDTASVVFNAQPGETAIDGDLNGDNLTDLFTVGSHHSLSAGLWFAAGKGDGKIARTATNIGGRGNGVWPDDRSPANFAGAQAITGHFGGTGLQDVLVYYPNNARAPGGAVVLRGNGDGSTIQAQLDGNYTYINAGMFEYLDPETFRMISNPIRLVNAGTHNTANPIPSLLGITSDDTGAYFLAYYPNAGTVGGYGTPMPLVNPTPTGQTDWNTWTIATAQSSAGRTDMFLWQASTGRLYLWKDVTWDETNGDLKHSGQHLLSEAFNKGLDVELRAADINNDGSTDLWTIAGGAAATAWLTSGSADDPVTITAQPSQKVLTGTHAWLLNDHADENIDDTVRPVIDAGKPAKDSIGTLTATGNAHWNSGDLFDPDAAFTGSTSIATTTPAVNTAADFTIDLWAKASNAGGIAVAQDGTNTSAVKIYAEASTSSWRFVMSSGDAATPAWTYANAPNGSFKPGAWTHLTATYTKSTGTMDLHINGKDVARAVHLTPWTPPANGQFRIGAARVAAGTSGIGGYLKGQVAEVLTFNQVVVSDSGNKNIRDFDGDNTTDFVGRHTDGTLRLFRGNGAGRLKPGYAVMASRWANMSEVISPGDFNGDGHPDIIGRYSDGDVRLYPGNGAGGLEGGFTTIATSWSNMSEIFSPGDFNGDAKPDLIGRYSNGDLRLYPGNGAGGLANTAPIVLAESWSNMADILSPGDFNSDGKADIIGRYSDGDLRFYPGDGKGGRLGGFTVIASKWSNMTLLFSPRDFTGDTYNDVVGRYSDGRLRVYRGNGAGGFTGSPIEQIYTWDNIAWAS